MRASGPRSQGSMRGGRRPADAKELARPSPGARAPRIRAARRGSPGMRAGGPRSQGSFHELGSALGYPVQIARIHFRLVAVRVEHEQRSTGTALAHGAAREDVRRGGPFGNLVKDVLGDGE